MITIILNERNSMKKPAPAQLSTAPRQLATDYINNPFTIALEGIKLLFKNATTVAIFLAIFSALTAGSYTYRNDANYDERTADNIEAFPVIEPSTAIVIGAIAVVVLFGVIVIASFLSGISAFTAAELANGRTVSFRQAARASFKRLWSFVWLQVLMGIKIFLWTLLFIIPGIVMAIRYSLANISFFDSTKNLKGNAAIKDSLALTEDGWRTTLAAQTLFSIITFGVIGPIVDVASKSILYKQFVAAQVKNEAKPPAHFLSQIIFALVLIAMIAIVLMFVLAAFAAINYFTNPTMMIEGPPSPPVLEIQEA